MEEMARSHFDSLKDPKTDTVSLERSIYTSILIIVKFISPYIYVYVYIDGGNGQESFRFIERS
jgi:hypothetical protein